MRDTVEGLAGAFDRLDRVLEGRRGSRPSDSVDLATVLVEGGLECRQVVLGADRAEIGEFVGEAGWMQQRIRGVGHPTSLFGEPRHDPLQCVEDDPYRTTAQCLGAGEYVDHAVRAHAVQRQAHDVSVVDAA